jgi:hypothetical protein
MSRRFGRRERRARSLCGGVDRERFEKRPVPPLPPEGPGVGVFTCLKWGGGVRSRGGGGRVVPANQPLTHKTSSNVSPTCSCSCYSPSTTTNVRPDTTTGEADHLVAGRTTPKPHTRIAQQRSTRKTHTKLFPSLGTSGVSHETADPPEAGGDRLRRGPGGVASWSGWGRPGRWCRVEVPPRLRGVRGVEPRRSPAMEGPRCVFLVLRCCARGVGVRRGEAGRSGSPVVVGGRWFGREGGGVMVGGGWGSEGGVERRGVRHHAASRAAWMPRRERVRSGEGGGERLAGRGSRSGADPRSSKG